MEKKLKKKKFVVETGETISQCLDRMALEGYTPVRRMEEPVFHEVKLDGKLETVVKEQKIVFEGKLND
ncbi:NETI motif-containing protein [Anaerobacillus alkaliphilus]|uniref:NETI motif-containing protein n=1 Tax=Anaerobacillus alkaliphilus TaxID=1548597 RepID=A0A4Q0VUF4_9BACI|nr:NETI motif-containing protein [Anaerobacillus alkaliphilus]RXJ02366.1 NETI motif-containing protein [Anaerobacillus alkaliphilus]